MMLMDKEDDDDDDDDEDDDDDDDEEEEVRGGSSHNNTARFPGNWILPVVMGSTVSNAVRQHLPALPVPHLTNAKSSTYISCVSATFHKCKICNCLNIDHPDLTSSQ